MPTFEEQLNEDMLSFFEQIQERRSRRPAVEYTMPKIEESVVTLEERQDGIDPQEPEQVVEE